MIKTTTLIKLLGTLSLAMVFVMASAFITIAQSDLEKGIEWFNKRAEGATGIKAKPEPINKAIGHFKAAMAIPADEKEAAYYLLRSYYYKGTFTSLPKDATKALFAEGKTLGEKMKNKYPTDIRFYHWHFVNLGRWGETYGKMAAAKEGVADQLKELCEKMIALDPAYDKGGGYRLMGILYLEAPYIPFFLTWPDDEESLKFLEKSFQYDPNHLNGLLYYAKVLEEEGEDEKAIEVLEKITKYTPRPDNLIEDRDDIAEAKVLLADWKD